MSRWIFNSIWVYLLNDTTTKDMVIDMCNRCDSVVDYLHSDNNIDRRSYDTRKTSNKISKHIGAIILLEIEDMLSKVDIIDRAGDIVDNDNLPIELSPNRQGFSNEEVEHLLFSTYSYVKMSISRLIKIHKSK